MYIRKRDGRSVPFDKMKIEQAVLSAFLAIDGKISTYAENKARTIAQYIAKISKEKELNVEEIQDFVEKGLMATKRKDVAKAYIKYREERTKIRQHNSTLMKNIKEKMAASNVEHQNANVDEESFGGKMGEANSEIMRCLAIDTLLSEKARENHLNNRIYIHDLDHYYVGDHNCLSIPFDKLLEKGFNTRQTDVRPANSINTAFQLVAVIFQLQSLQQFGGVSATHLDWTMVPYVRKSFFKHYIDGLKYIAHWNSESIESEKKSRISFINFDINDTDFYQVSCAWKYAYDMTLKEIQQAVEGMYHNLR